MLTALNNTLDNSINSLGFSSSKELLRFGLVRTLTPIETIKAFSENISKIHRVVIIKPLDKKSTDVFIEIIEFLSQVNLRTVIGTVS